MITNFTYFRSIGHTRVFAINSDILREITSYMELHDVISLMYCSKRTIEMFGINIVCDTNVIREFIRKHVSLRLLKKCYTVFNVPQPGIQYYQLFVTVPERRVQNSSAMTDHDLADVSVKTFNTASYFDHNYPIIFSIRKKYCRVSHIDYFIIGFYSVGYIRVVAKFQGSSMTVKNVLFYTRMFVPNNYSVLRDRPNSLRSEQQSCDRIFDTIGLINEIFTENTPRFSKPWVKKYECRRQTSQSKSGVKDSRQIERGEFGVVSPRQISGEFGATQLRQIYSVTSILRLDDKVRELSKLV